MQSQSYESIRLDLIDDNPELARDIDPARYAYLKETIQTHGLIHPITVSEGGDGRYTLRCGRTRFLVHQELGLETIDAQVVETEDEDEAEMLRIAENLARSDSGIDKVIQLKRYNELREKKFGPAEKRGPGRPKANSPLSGELQVASPPTPKSAQDYKYERLAREFTTPQLMVLKEMEIPINDCEAILSAAKKDPETIAKIVNKVAQDIPVPQAIALILEPSGGVVDTKAVQAVISQYDNQKTAMSVASELSNEDWLHTYCSEVRAPLVTANNHAVFDWNALFYRKIHKALQQFRTDIRDAVVAEKSKGHGGPVVGLFFDVLKLEHPGKWILCGQCHGGGKSPSGSYCSKCLGDGFKKTETRL